MRNIVTYLFLFSVSITWAQQQTAATVDRDTILIGEEIILNLNTTIEPGQIVLFPEAKETFGKLEILEKYRLDSIKKKARLSLNQRYGLTQFDSGAYWIPSLNITIDGIDIKTDSIPVYIRDVVVDTTKQGLFGVKERVDLDLPDAPFPISPWWFVLLLPIGILFWALSQKRKQLQLQAAIPPYEAAITAFENLSNSELLESNKYKELYSAITDILKTYVTEKIDDGALESTSFQLVGLLEKSDLIDFSRDQISELKTILSRSDLAKFAKGTPDALTARSDVKWAKELVTYIHNVLPPPTEEELMRDAAYRAAIRKKKQRKNILIGSGIGLLILIVATSIWVWKAGVDNVKDQVFGNYTRELLEREWLKSDYGIPPMSLESPIILTRVLNDSLILTQDDMPMPHGLDVSSTYDERAKFEMGSTHEPFYFAFKNNQFSEYLRYMASDSNNYALESTRYEIQRAYSYLEKQGATNIIQKDEPIKHINGYEGVRIYGTCNFTIDGDKVTKNYEFINYALTGGFQQLIFIYDDENVPVLSDRDFAKAVKERIHNSLKVPQPKNDQ